MNVIINRTDAIGDTLLTLPMAKLIKDSYPDAKVTFIISEKSKELFSNHPYVDKTWIFPVKSNFWSQLLFLKKSFKERPVDAFFHVGGSLVPAFYAWLLRIKIRGGLKSKLQTFLFLNKGQRQRRSIVIMHESDYNLNLLEAIGINYNSVNRISLKPALGLSEIEKVRALESFNGDLEKGGFDSNLPMIFIHPGMTGHTLNWSSRNYARFISKLYLKVGEKYNYILSYTPNDEEYLRKFKEELAKTVHHHLNHKIYFFDGSKRGLRDYMGVLSFAKLFVGPSTGTTHIANTLSIPQIAIYSPIKVQSEMRWGPFDQTRPEVKIVVPDVVCGQSYHCAGESCPYYKCMGKIEIDDVLELAVSILSPKEEL